MTTTLTTNQRSNGWLLVLLAIAAIIAFALTVGQLELSHHAALGRDNTSMDAAAIQSQINKGGCKKTEIYICPAHNQIKMLCKLDSELWAGLIIGTASEPPVIVTGYVAPISYWYGTVKRDECYLSINQGVFQ